MESLIINGGNRLYGDVPISGMKNSALPIIYATLLIKERCILKNIPNVSDIRNSLLILESMGATIKRIDNNAYEIDTRDTCPFIKRSDLVSRLRASYYLLGAMISRFGEVEIPYPGGCNIGPRPIEQHIKGFNLLGASCIEEQGFIKIKAKNKLKSKKITLDKISVGATINMVLASVFIDGITVIENVAIEPHVDDLICFLNNAGAKIIRNGRIILVQGVKKLSGVTYSIYPDMIEALTYITFLGATKGEINLLGCEPEHLTYSLDIFREMGFKFIINDKTINVRAESLKGVCVETQPYPLFPTDIHPQMASLLCFCGGEITENIFPSRFAYVNELRKMGASIEQKGNKVIINQSFLKGAELDATDLRAGAALITAALGAEGQSTINNVNYIVRGYEQIIEKITSIGGKIQLKGV